MPFVCKYLNSSEYGEPSGFAGIIRTEPARAIGPSDPGAIQLLLGVF